MQQLESLVSDIWCRRLLEDADEPDDECNLSVRRFAPEEGEGNGALKRAYNQKQAKCDVKNPERYDVGEDDRCYMFSMAVAASLTEMEPGEQESLLKTRSLLKRLRRCEGKVEKERRWVAARNGLRDLGLQ